MTTETTRRARTIRTVFYRLAKVVKINNAYYANSAVLRCVDHLQHNQYNATHAEVYDESNGDLHAVVRRRVTGDLEILFRRAVKEGK